MSPLFLCLERKHFSVQDNSVVLCVVQQSSLTLAQRLEGEVDPLKSLVSIVQTLEHRFWFVGFVCSHCLKYLISCLGYLLYVLWGEDPRTVCEIQNVKMKRFICSTSGEGGRRGCASVEEHSAERPQQGVLLLQPSSQQSQGKGSADPGVPWRRDTPRQEGGCAEPTSPALCHAHKITLATELTAWKQQLLLNEKH